MSHGNLQHREETIIFSELITRLGLTNSKVSTGEVGLCDLGTDVATTTHALSRSTVVPHLNYKQHPLGGEDISG